MDLRRQFNVAGRHGSGAARGRPWTLNAALLVVAAICSIQIAGCATEDTPASPPRTSAVECVQPILYDDFERPDGPLVPGTAPSDHVWMMAEHFLFQTPVIQDGRLTASPGVSYARVDFGNTPVRLTGWLSWADGAAGVPVVAMVSSSVGFDPPNDLLHLVIGLERWTLQVREAGGDLIDLVARTHTMRTDGTVYRISMIVEGDTATIVGPDDIAVSHTDPRIGRLHGRYLFWETLYEPGEPQPRWETVVSSC